MLVNQPQNTLHISSHEHQTESGLRKDCSEVETMMAVIRAVSPGFELRSYLEGKTDLTLAGLRQILRPQYAEKDATMLYKQMTK